MENEIEVNGKAYVLKSSIREGKPATEHKGMKYDGVLQEVGKVKQKRKCPVCGEMFEPLPTRTITCGRPCRIIMQARHRVAEAERKLEKAKDLLFKKEQAWKENKLPMGRGRAI